MKISIVIPVYNTEKYITRCLNSVMRQTYEGPMECILIDDCCTDRSMTLAEQSIHNYTEGSIKFSIHRQTHNQGLSAARNKGADVSTGDYIFFLDSDDAITSDCIATMASLAEEHPDADFVQGNILAEDGTISKYGNRKTVTTFSSNHSELEELILSVFTYSACNRLIKRSFIMDNRLFFPEGYVHEDTYWCYFVAKKVKAAVFTEKGTYTYYANVDSITTSVDIASRERRFLSRIHIAKSIYADVRSDSPATPAEMQYLASDITACMAVASDLRSFRHWNILWKLMLDMLLGSIPDVSLTRLIFFFCTLPPLCFLIKYKWWYWRLQHHIVSRI